MGRTSMGDVFALAEIDGRQELYESDGEGRLQPWGLKIEATVSPSSGALTANELLLNLVQLLVGNVILVRVPGEVKIPASV
jgi:hypothetical protein